MASVRSVAPMDIERFSSRGNCFAVCAKEIVDFVAARDFRELCSSATVLQVSIGMHSHPLFSS